MSDKEVGSPVEEDSPPVSPEPKSPRLNGDFFVVSNNESESDSFSSTSLSVDRIKSQGSSLSSFADVGIQEVEVTLEKGHSEDVVAKLVEDARKEISFPGLLSSEDCDVSELDSLGNMKGSGDEERGSDGQNVAQNPDVLHGYQTVPDDTVKKTDLNRDRSVSDGEVSIDHSTNLTQLSPRSERLRVRASTDPGIGDDEVDDDAVNFDNITYLGSSTVNAPVSEIELKRTMAILGEHTEVAIEVLLSVGSTSDSFIRLIDPENKTVIASYQIQRILFCGRGDLEGNEKDCFAFNTVHGKSEYFHCHVFRCKEPDMAGNILKSFAFSFRRQRKRQQQLKEPFFDAHPSVISMNSLVYKFDVLLDILEEDSKGFSSVARDKNCFKLRQNLRKKVVVTVTQLTNRHLIIERCFGLLICPGRNVRYSDMHLLSDVSLEVTDNGKTYVLVGHWSPQVRDLLVLNTETPKDTRVFMTIAVDLVATQVQEPIRFVKETKAKVYPTGEKFWIPSKAKIHEVYVMKLKEVIDSESGRKEYEVDSIKNETEMVAYERQTYLQQRKQEHEQQLQQQSSEDEEEDEEPLLSGSGTVQKECSEEELGNWADVLSKWKDVDNRPAQLSKLIRRQGVPEPLRGQVWQMLVGLQENDELLQIYKHMLKKTSPTEQVILWDMHRTFPAHEYFKITGGEGQEVLYRMSKAYSVYDEEVGYCQGLSFISAVLLLHLPEEQAFAVLVKIMSVYGLRDMFRNEFETLHMRFFQMERFLEELLPDLFSHFQYNNIEAHMYASQWFLTLFTAKFPLPMVYRIMDVLLCEGMNVVFKVALALLKVSRKELLQMDFEGILKHFRVSMPKKYLEGDEQIKQLINSALSIKVTNKKLKKYEKEFIIQKEQEAQLEDPVERFKRENKRLMDSNMRLEHENDNLAHELVTTKVDLHNKLVESEEKVEDLSQELALTNKSLTEAEDQKEKFKADGLQVKEMWRRNLGEAEEERKRHTAIIEEYKKICSQLDERSETFKEDLRQELVEIKRRIGSCENCSALFSEEGQASETDRDGFKASFKVVDTEEKLRELELELAQTKLSLVEAECRSQDLGHKLAAFVAAAEENKSWFKRLSMVSVKESK